MPDRSPHPPSSDPRKRFLAALRNSLTQHTFVKLVLGKYKGPESDLKKVMIRKLSVKDQRCLSFVTVYKTQEMTKNTSIKDGIQTIDEHLGDPFMSAHLFTSTEEIQVEFSKKGKCFWHSNATRSRMAANKTHNREKERFLDPGKPFLAALGITAEQHKIRSSMFRKWKQINKFLEIFRQAFLSSQLSETQEVRVVDFGAGKGYLTFAIHDLLRDALGINAQVTGIDLREDLVRFCNETTETLSLDGLYFHQGDITSYMPEAIDVMIALHACDTATDQAIHMGIRAGAKMILCAPCCHKEVRKQIRSPEVLEPMLRFGVHMGQEAEMLTDALRALLLEVNGYQTKILEFISLEHTSKNKMLLAVKHASPVDREGLLKKIRRLKEFYGIQKHSLETLLNADAPLEKSMESE